MESAFEAARANAKNSTFLSFNEETVKVAIVVPILRQLGWADRDITYEKTVGQAQVKKLDIALEAEQIISIAIETKAAKESNLGKFSGLIAKQTLLAGFRFGVVTNGMVWVLYRIDTGAATKVATLSILEHGIEEFANYFGYEKITTGEAAAYWNSDPCLDEKLFENILFGPELMTLYKTSLSENHRPCPTNEQYTRLCSKIRFENTSRRNDKIVRNITKRKQERDDKVELIDNVFHTALRDRANRRKSSMGQMTYYIGRHGVTVQVRVATSRSPGYISFNIMVDKEAVVKAEKNFRSELMKIATKHDISLKLPLKKVESDNKRYEWLLKPIPADDEIIACAEKFACFASDVKKWLTRS